MHYAIVAFGEHSRSSGSDWREDLKNDRVECGLALTEKEFVAILVRGLLAERHPVPPWVHDQEVGSFFLSTSGDGTVRLRLFGAPPPQQVTPGQSG